MTTYTTPPHGPIEDRSYLWPQPSYSRPRWTLAYWHAGRIVDEHGVISEPATWPDVLGVLAANHCILYVPDLDRWPHTAAAIHDRDAEVAAAEGGYGSNIYAAYRRKHYHVMQGDAWGITTDAAGLRTLRRVLDAGGIGDYPSAGGWGQALMRHYYPRGAARLANLSRWYWQLCKDHLIGGRVDALRLRAKFDVAYEYDQNSAYANAMLQVPAGAPSWWEDKYDRGNGWPPKDAATGYLHCRVTVPATLVLSPLPRRGEDGIVHYRQAAGETFAGWYWTEEITAAIAAGLTVYAEHGIAWPDTDDRFARWVQVMDMLRRRFGRDPDAAALVKRATVAAIGRFAADVDVATITAHPSPGDEPLTDALLGPANPYYIHRERRERPGLLPHLFSYASMQTRLAIYTAALEAQRNGTLIATNYDAVFTSAPMEQLAMGAGVGQWKLKLHHDATAPAKRAWVSDEQTTLPGVTGTARERAVRSARQRKG